MTQDLFSEFSEITAAQWKEKIVRDLKGESFESLIWKNHNGFDIQPFYTAEHLNHHAGPSFAHTDWVHAVRPLLKQDEEINKTILHLLNAGANGISVNIGNSRPDKLLRGIDLSMISATIYCSSGSSLDFLSKSGSSALTVGFENLQKSEDLQKSLDTFARLQHLNPRLILSDAQQWSHKGAAEYLEIAILFSQIAEWKKAGFKGQAAIRTAVNADLFVQLSKLRAIRRLWNLLGENATPLYIIAESSLSMQAVSDVYNNMIRNSVAAFAAVAGGCNELVVHGHDVLTENTAEAMRLALNQQLILKEECYLDQVADVATGSYFIETLTDQLAEKALKEFQKIEQHGGYFSYLNSEELQKKIADQAASRIQRVLEDKEVIVGVNRFRNNVPDKNQISLHNLTKQLGIVNPAIQYDLTKQDK